MTKRGRISGIGGRHADTDFVRAEIPLEEIRKLIPPDSKVGKTRYEDDVTTDAERPIPGLGQQLRERAVMSDITTEQIVEAGASALLGDNCPDEGELCSCADWHREAETALTAMLPLIRKQLADEVRGHFATDEHPGMDRSTAEMYEDIVLEAANVIEEGVEG